MVGWVFADGEKKVLAVGLEAMRQAHLRSVSFVLFVQDAQALDGVMIQMTSVFPFGNSQIFEVAFLVICFPGVT